MRLQETERRSRSSRRKRTRDFVRHGEASRVSDAKAAKNLPPSAERAARMLARLERARPQRRRKTDSRPGSRAIAAGAVGRDKDKLHILLIDEFLRCRRATWQQRRQDQESWGAETTMSRSAQTV
jgi:hypothetical protein